MKEKYKLQIKLSLLRKDDESGDEDLKEKEKEELEQKLNHLEDQT